MNNICSHIGFNFFFVNELKIKIIYIRLIIVIIFKLVYKKYIKFIVF